MKKLLLVALSFLAVNAFAQKDIMISMSTPVTGQTIYAGTPFNINFSIKNTGAVDVDATDSIYIYVVINNQVVSQAYLNHGAITVGNTVNSALNGYTLNFTQGADSVNFCIATLLRYNGPLDTINTNNIACALVKMSTATGINELSTGGSIKVYPNPASQLVQFDFDYNKTSTLRIYDIAGKLVDSKEVLSGISSIDVSGFNNGIYLYEIRSAENELLKTGKFSVAH